MTRTKEVARKRKASGDDKKDKKKLKKGKDAKPRKEKKNFKKDFKKGQGFNKGKKGVKRKRGPESTEKPNWKEFKAKKKQRKEESKDKKPYSEAVNALLSVFGINFQTIKKPARMKRVGEVMAKIGDDLKNVINRKGSARAVILLIKHGNVDHRTKIVNSLKPLFLDLCKDAKCHHIILQMLVYSNDAMTATICTELMKHVGQLSNNRYGSMVLDRVLVNPDCKRYKLLILQQLYSKIYAQLPAMNEKDEPLELGEILKKDAGDKPFILENMKKYLENQLSKTPSLVIVQMVLRQYLLHCSPGDYSVMVDSMIPVVMQFLNSEDGCLSVLEAFNYSKAKQRKKLLQGFREHIVQMSSDVETLRILLRAIDVTDDTVLTKKIVLSELLGSLEDVMSNERSRLLFLHILDPRSPRYFKKHLQYLPEPTTTGDRANSKKSPEQRQTELLKHVLEPIVEHLKSNVGDLVKKNEPFLYSVLLQCFGKMHPLTELGQGLLVKVAEYCIENMSVFSESIAHRRLRGLVELVPEFSSTLISRLSVTEIQEIARDKSAIVLVRCIQKGSETMKTKIVKALKPIAGELKALEGKSVKILVAEAAL